jgi:serpin B
MKKTICWLLLLVMLLAGCTGKAVEKTAGENPILQSEPAPQGSDITPPAVENDEPTPTIPPIDGYNDFMSVLSAALMDGQSNKNLSPVSVYIALAMAAEGAKGDTQEELLAILGEKKLKDLRKSVEQMLKDLKTEGTSGELVLANSIWLGRQDESVAFHAAYLKTLAKSYGAEAGAVRFGAAEAGEKIAAWIKEMTRDKIQPSEDAMTFNADTLAVLINTIYLKDSWQKPFDPERTEQDTFSGLQGKEIIVKYMRRTDSNAAVVRGEGYLRYALPLRDVGRMVFVLPNEEVSLESLLGSPEKINELLRGGEEVNADVDIKVPKFTFQDRTDLEKTLMDLGVRISFTGGADFSGITDTPAHISRVLQESHIGVDEDGVEAAAYTMIALAKSSMSIETRDKIDFHLTRPFLYAIESYDGTVLFICTVTEPDKAQ